MDGKTRLQKACDACNIRKVKCDEGGPPCQSCTALDIPCTYNRPKKRRGPPNKHAEAIKKQKAEAKAAEKAPPPTTVLPAPTSKILPSDTSSEQSLLDLSGESICPLPTLQLLVDDYFLFIHPLIPVPHEPTFRQAFANREDVTNKRFLALLASMIGTLVASFPRRPRLHLRTDSAESMYPNSMALVKRCHDIAVQARGLGYLDTSTTIEDAAISYHLSLCSSYVYNMRRCRMYLGECMTILRVYNLYKPSRQGVANLSPVVAASPVSEAQYQLVDPSEATDNLLVQEQGRRLFYICLAGFQTLHQLGSADGRAYIPPETPTDRYPPLPIEVDDEYLSANQCVSQPIGIVPQLTGFNANVRIFQCYNSLLALEIAFNSSGAMSWDNQRQLIWESLQQAKTITADLPPELSLHHPQQVQQLSPPLMNLGGWPPAYGDGVTNRDQERRKIQYEIQKVNIYISQLSTRSYLVDKYWTLFDGHTRLEKKRAASSSASNTPILMPSTQMSSLGATTTSNIKYEPGDTTTTAPDAEVHAQTDHMGYMMRQERGLVIKDLLCLLKSVQEIHIEPNGASFTQKVRQIASTLLSLPQELNTTLQTTTDPITGTSTTTATTPTPQPGAQPLSTSDAENYLRTFLDILVRLEGVGVTGGDPIQTATISSSNINIKKDELNINQNVVNNNIDMLNVDAAASTLLADPMVASAAYPSPNGNEAYLQAMPYAGDGISAREEEELRQWASFKEFQKTFMEDGGLLYSI
ncbi:hypothetical protein UA08_05595 [Talaromyces atroroseus]|uniref:Zn(2)-C6 fungal-type domain-containing protein n=1 Tax=Talaromyces atroroseus TaxID=1441469 RepID=A0A225AEA8_TALAT|nr:hypothetical protein UA08_05595 [Talaromyces atroroseus]OKL58860.1 hypothetical protein UA08_05595 [Talaromyces atroroseus]